MEARDLLLAEGPLPSENNRQNVNKDDLCVHEEHELHSEANHWITVVSYPSYSDGFG